MISTIHFYIALNSEIFSNLDSTYGIEYAM